MNNSTNQFVQTTIEDGQVLELVNYDFGLTRRGFVQVLGAGILIATAAGPALAQQRAGGRGARGGFGGGGPVNVSARVHIAKDGALTVMTGKVEGGQGARAEISQAAAEELRVSVDKIALVMADTALTPDDGATVGSQTTGRTLPPVRQGCAAARNLVLDFAAKKWGVGRDTLTVQDGAATDGSRRFTYADLASADGSDEAFKRPPGSDVTVTPVAEWKIMGVAAPRPNRRDLVTGAHQYPSAIIRPGMLYAKVLRAPSYGAKLKSVDVAGVRGMDGVSVVQDGDFVAVAAPTTYQAKKALAAIEKTAQWERAPHPSSGELPEYLRKNARGGIPESPFADEMKSAARTLKASYDVAYVQHTPMEPRAAVAEWQDGKVTVWTASQNPFSVRNEVASALKASPENVRIIIPDFGGGFGGKHTGECAVEAARIAQSVGKPVALRWTREEEFTWAYFRPSGAIDIQASLDGNGMITSWHFVTINPGNPGMDTPYRVGKNQAQAIQTSQPLRQGSYRALGATANHFARESFMDELAAASGRDPLAFRQAHLDNPRIKAVLEEAAKAFDWATRRAGKDQNIGVGLACGTEKGSFVATCAEVAVDRNQGVIRVRRICEAFECGAIVNPPNLHSQVTGAIIQGLGPALCEAMEFEGGAILNPSLLQYKVPRFADVPELDIHLLNRPDLPSVGAGETPVVCVAPAIANAVFHATGQRIRQMPIKLQTA